jgi:hypothetical protein
MGIRLVVILFSAQLRCAEARLAICLLSTSIDGQEPSSLSRLEIISKSRRMQKQQNSDNRRGRTTETRPWASSIRRSSRTGLSDTRRWLLPQRMALFYSTLNHRQTRQAAQRNIYFGAGGWRAGIWGTMDWQIIGPIAIGTP